MATMSPEVWNVVKYNMSTNGLREIGLMFPELREEVSRLLNACPTPIINASQIGDKFFSGMRMKYVGSKYSHRHGLIVTICETPMEMAIEGAEVCFKTDDGQHYSAPYADLVRP